MKRKRTLWRMEKTGWPFILLALHTERRSFFANLSNCTIINDNQQGIIPRFWVNESKQRKKDICRCVYGDVLPDAATFADEIGCIWIGIMQLMFHFSRSVGHMCL